MRSSGGIVRAARVAVASAAILALLLAACDARETAPEVPQWTLTETLRIGTMEDGPASFSWIRGLDADAQGRVWAFDHADQELRVFSADGAHLMDVGGKGAGPGEFLDAEGFSFAKDGRLWVKDPGNGRLSVLSSDGTFEESGALTLCGRVAVWDPVMTRPDRILDSDCFVRPDRSAGSHVLSYRTDFSAVDTIGPVASCGSEALQEAGLFVTTSGTSTRYQAIPWAASALWAVGGVGETWCVPNTSRFEIFRTLPGARDTSRISTVIADVPVTQSERDSVIAGFEENGPTGLDFSRIPRIKPAIDRITVDDDGQLWVRSTNSAGELEFRVYSPEGRPVATARLAGRQLSIFSPFVVRGNAIYTTSVDHEETPIILRFAIGRPSR